MPWPGTYVQMLRCFCNGGVSLFGVVCFHVCMCVLFLQRKWKVQVGVRLMSCFSRVLFESSCGVLVCSCQLLRRRQHLLQSLHLRPLQPVARKSDRVIVTRMCLTTCSRQSDRTAQATRAGTPREP